jgi:hypothetical protein
VSPVHFLKQNGKKAKDGPAILKELLEEQTKLAPFLQMLPHCAQLLKVSVTIELSDALHFLDAF